MVMETRSRTRIRSLQNQATSFQNMNLYYRKRPRKAHKTFKHISGFYSAPPAATAEVPPVPAMAETPAVPEAPAVAAMEETWAVPATAETWEVPTTAEPPEVAATAEAPVAAAAESSNVVAMAESPVVAVIAKTAAVVPPPMPALGSTRDRPLQVCEHEEEKETKIKMNPLTRLRPLPNPRRRSDNSAQIHEQTSMVIAGVKSTLVKRLIFGKTQTVDLMVDCANDAFTALNFLGADYSSFYNHIRIFIGYQNDLRIAERESVMSSFSELKNRYENAIVHANDMEEALSQAEYSLEMAKKKKMHLERQIEEATDLICRLKQVVANIELSEGSLKHEKQKYIAAHKIAQAQEQILGTQVDAAAIVHMGIEQRKKAALEGIKSTTRLLQSLDYKYAFETAMGPHDEPVEH